MNEATRIAVDDVKHELALVVKQLRNHADELESLAGRVATETQWAPDAVLSLASADAVNPRAVCKLTRAAMRLALVLEASK